MPTKSQLDAEARYSDDGNRSIDLLDRLEQMLGDDEDMQDLPDDDGVGSVRQEPQEPSLGMQVVQSSDAVDEEVWADGSGVHGDVRPAVGPRPNNPDAT